MKTKLLKILSGPGISVAIYFLLRQIQSEENVARMGAIAGWMAVWWIFEAVPLAVTAMLPIFLYPFGNIMGTREVAPLYMNDVLFLFVGGFTMAFAMEKWNLHKRIALKIITSIGADPPRILMGLMLASYLLSMWLSNTSTTLMMIPPTLAVIAHMDKLYPEHSRKATIGMLLGIAYASSIGGTATLVGTPPNLIFLSHFSATFPDEPPVSFLQWFMMGLPLSFVFLVAAYFLLKKMYIKEVYGVADTTVFLSEYKSLGKMKLEEKIVFALFSIMAILWFTRADLMIGDFRIPGWSSLFIQPTFFQDGTIAIMIALLLFVIPSKSNEGSMLMDWETMKKLPYGIILLFGGGFALAKGFTESGLSNWLAVQLDFISSLPVVVMIVVVCLFMTFLTEITSNMATTQLILPILASIAIGSGIEPLYLMIPATFSASFAFMLPVATAPNTIIFSSEKLKVSDMVRTGFWLNLIGVVITTLAMIFIGKYVFNFG